MSAAWAAAPSSWPRPRLRFSRMMPALTLEWCSGCVIESTEAIVPWHSMSAMTRPSMPFCCTAGTYCGRPSSSRNHAAMSSMSMSAKQPTERDMFGARWLGTEPQPRGIVVIRCPLARGRFSSPPQPLISMAPPLVKDALEG